MGGILLHVLWGEGGGCSCRTACYTSVLHHGVVKVLYGPGVGIADRLDVKCGHRLFPCYIGASSVMVEHFIDGCVTFLREISL
jgi:hypothetical protein